MFISLLKDIEKEEHYTKHAVYFCSTRYHYIGPGKLKCTFYK